MRAGLIVVVALVVSAGCSRAAPAGPPGAATVVRVVDGDTIVAHVGGRDEDVRLVGINTPETKDPRKPVECFGKEASAHLAELLPKGEAIRLERDVEPRDHFGRLLAYVYRRRDELFVNLDLAAGGYAEALTIPPNVAHTDDLLAAVAGARSAGEGLWGACGGPDLPVTSPP